MLRGRQLLWAMIGVGVAVRLYIAFATYGVEFDIDSYRVVAEALNDGSPLDTYDVISEGEFTRWPYPPAYWPAVFAAFKLEHRTDIAMHGLIQILPILADAAIALLVHHYLGVRGFAERSRLFGAGLVAFGPVFANVSGYHGHFDSFAILPAVAALVLWERPGLPNRALAAGLLIGLGASLKTVPILTLLALLPTARSWREGATLVAAAAAVPLATIAPFALTDPDGIELIATYRGVGGLAGLSLVLQPEFARVWFDAGFHPGFNGPAQALFDHGSLLLGVALLACGLAMLRRRTPPPPAACVVWLVVFVLGASYTFHFTVWGLPFFIMAGYLREAALLQAALLPPVIFLQAKFDEPTLAYPYAAIMIAIWLGMVVALARLLRRIISAPAAPVASVQA